MPANALVSTATEEREFAAAVAAAQREQFKDQPPSHAERAAFLRGLLARIDEGYVVARGGWRQVIVPEYAPTDPRRLRAAQPHAGGLSPGALAGLIGGSVLALVLLIALIPSGGAKGVAAPTAGPTVIIGTRTTVAATSIPPTVAAGFVTADGAVAAPIHPNGLDLAGRSFGVYQAPVQKNTWQVSMDPGLANWVPGAILNWSFALYLDRDPAATTPAWLAGLQVGSPATVRVVAQDRTIRTLAFTLTERRRIARTQTEIFNPDVPGLTIAIKDGAGDSWLLLRGSEIAAGAAPVDLPVTRVPTPGTSAPVRPTFPAATPVSAPGPQGGERP